VTPQRVAGAGVGAAIWVAGVLLLDGRAATIAFAVVFALALPALLHAVDGEQAERRRTVQLAVFLLLLLPLAVLVFDNEDGLALLVPAGIAAGLLVNLGSRRRPPEPSR